MLCLSGSPDPVSSAQDKKECLFSFSESVPLCKSFICICLCAVLACGLTADMVLTDICGHVQASF